MNEIILENNIIHLRGEVTYATVTPLCRQLQSLLQSHVIALDCSDVTKVDSSITALFIAALKKAKTLGAKLSITQLPASVITLVKLYDLETKVITTQPLQLPSPNNTQ